MGLSNWILNRANPSNRTAVTLRASDSVSLDNEIMKFERKGYVRAGSPYTAREGGVYGKLVFFQPMTLVVTDQSVQPSNPKPVEVKQESVQKKSYKGLFIVLAVIVGLFMIMFIVAQINSLIMFREHKDFFREYDMELMK